MKPEFVFDNARVATISDQGWVPTSGFDFQPGDIVRNVATGTERVVVSFMSSQGLLEFDDSHLVGWTNAQGWMATGERAPQDG